jgi:hypothetical protein
MITRKSADALRFSRPVIYVDSSALMTLVRFEDGSTTLREWLS